MKAEITNFDNREYLSQDLQVEITSGSIKNRIVTVETSYTPKFSNTKYKQGDRLLIGYINGGANNENFYVISYNRSTPLLLLITIFLVISVLVAKKKSIYSLLGMSMSILILTLFILPAIVNGSNPLVVSILGMLVMVPILFYVSHGVNKKTTSAVLGTAITLTLTALLAVIFVKLMRLTGLTNGEVETLLYLKEGNFDMQGVLLAGILMGALGVIDDVSMTQASVVEEFHRHEKTLSRKEIFHKAMNVGRDHIASVINTLILVYVGGSLTTLLLFTEFPRPIKVLMNSEVVLIPIVIALIGSIGLILAIPSTTLLAIMMTKRPKRHKTEN